MYDLALLRVDGIILNIYLLFLLSHIGDFVR
jgi:hypothetical protein